MEVTPTTVSVDGGQFSVTTSAEDESGIDQVSINWANPVGAVGSVGCHFTSGTCTTTTTVGSGVWGISGDYQLSAIYIYDSNSIYRIYYPNGTWTELGGGSGTHGLSFPDLTLVDAS
jgi:hypothetical protein